MIKQFPKFTKISIDSKTEIEELTYKFEPYSDFNFTSLFCWDTDNSTEVSILNNNLVIKMADYITGETIYSILGDREIDASLNVLLELTDKLYLVPEAVVSSIENANSFKVEQDRDQFDYIYTLPSQADLNGGRYKNKRNKISKFMRTYSDELSLKKIKFSDPKIKKDIHDLFLKWTVERKLEAIEFQRESKTIDKLFDYAKNFELIGIQVFLSDECVGFSINEIVQNEYAICHFQKSILTFENIDVFLSNLVAKELKHFGCKYVNWEQDLGIAGLRELKSSYAQEFFLKKYTIEKIID